MSNDEFPKYRVLHYFESTDVIMDELTTQMFHDSLLVYVDDFCEAYNRGDIKPKYYLGGVNFYHEFIQYLESKNIKVTFK